MIYAYQETTEKFKDIAGKWMVRVSIADTEAIFLKFDKEPTTKEVEAEVAIYIENLTKDKTTRLEIINEQIEGLMREKTILEKEISKT